jgi:hypothetical protein
MPDGLSVFPGHKIKTVSLVEAGEAENGRDAFKLVVGKRMDDVPLGARFDGRILSCLGFDRTTAVGRLVNRRHGT